MYVVNGDEMPWSLDVQIFKYFTFGFRETKVCFPLSLFFSFLLGGMSLVAVTNIKDNAWETVGRVNQSEYEFKRGAGLSNEFYMA